MMPEPLPNASCSDKCLDSITIPTVGDKFFSKTNLAAAAIS